jgi:hypothetical protein
MLQRVPSMECLVEFVLDPAPASERLAASPFYPTSSA